MLGITLLLLAAAAGDPATSSAQASAPATTAAPAPSAKGRRMEEPAPAPPPSALRRLMQAQLDMPPREDGSGGISGPEADAVMARYLASIGKPLGTGQGSSSSYAQSSYAQGSHP